MRARFRRKDDGAASAGSSFPGLPFDDKSLEFKRGVEFGLLFARVKDYGRAAMAVHADMAELVIRLAEHCGLPFSGLPHEHEGHCNDCKDGGEWIDVTIG
jgi:hypothetical protein